MDAETATQLARGLAEYVKDKDAAKAWREVADLIEQQTRLIEAQRGIKEDFFRASDLYDKAEEKLEAAQARIAELESQLQDKCDHVAELLGAYDQE